MNDHIAREAPSVPHRDPRDRSNEIVEMLAAHEAMRRDRDGVLIERAKRMEP